MIHIIIGTKAQLIKMAPIMRRLQERKIPYNYISTGQHKSTMSDIHADFGIREPDITLYEGSDVTSIISMLVFGVRLLWATMRKGSVIFKKDKAGIVLVHGDTFSTLVGALMGRMQKLKVGHVESGLRSFNLLAPFPEELIRILVFRFSSYFFCPGDWAIENLNNIRGVKVNTYANTLLDAFRCALSDSVKPSKPGLIPNHSYAVVTLHRFENIRSLKAMKRLIDAVTMIADQQRLLFVLHAPTEIQLLRFGYYDQLRNHPNIEFRQRYGYFDFIRLMQKADFIVSDGGSNQEECFYLGKPLLILREVTERLEGLGENAVLSRFDSNIIHHFLINYKSLCRHQYAGEVSPSDIIIDACAKFY